MKEKITIFLQLKAKRRQKNHGLSETAILAKPAPSTADPDAERHSAGANPSQGKCRLPQTKKSEVNALFPLS